MSPSEIQWWIAIGGFLVLVAALKVFDKAPSTQYIQEALTALNSRGGNIAILAVFCIYFFHHAVVMFYRLQDMVAAGALKPDNAFAMMGAQFVTSSAFGGFSGALLTMMTGAGSKGRATDFSNVSSTSTTTDNNNSASTNNGVINDPNAKP